MASPYVYERQSEYWISRQIEEFFLDVGFEVMTFPLSQYNERLVPADFIFFDKRHSKLFGFQYKALYRNNRWDFWPMDLDQHRRLASFDWIYYCLSELKTSRDHGVALYLVRIVSPKDFKFQDRLRTSDEWRFPNYSRWGAFYQDLERCNKGVFVASREQLRRHLDPGENRVLPWELADLIVDVFLTDFASRHTVHLSPLLDFGKFGKGGEENPRNQVF